MNLKKHINIGDEYGRLTIIEEIPPIKSNKQNNRAVRCKCECGNIIDVIFDRLRNKKSCGCLHSDTARETQLKSHLTHGLTKHPLYSRWQDMKRRCRETPTKRQLKNYEHYGEKGIRVCKEWGNDFLAFYNWSIENGFSEELLIDRIDNNLGYSPNNCRWVTHPNSNRNTSRNIMVGDLCLQDFCQYNNLPYSAIRARINRLNWPLDKALKTPLQKTKTL